MNIKPIDTFNWEVRDLKIDWDNWYKEFSLYINIVKFEGEGENEAAKAGHVLQQKKSLLMYLIGKKVGKFLQHLNLRKVMLMYRKKGLLL